MPVLFEVTLRLQEALRCPQGVLRMIAAMTDPPIIRRLLSHLKLAAAPHRLRPRASSKGVLPGSLPNFPLLIGG